MPKVLIHYTSDGIQMGLWRQTSDEILDSYYPDDPGKWEKRGKAVLEDISPHTDIDEYFDRLTEHSSYFDRYGTTEAEDDEPFDAIWYRTKKESSKE